MSVPNLTVKRPELCKQCLAGAMCTRAVIHGGWTCLDVRGVYDAGFRAALTKLQNALDAARQQKHERVPAPPVRRPRRRRRPTAGKITDTELSSTPDTEPEE